jgi:quercetin dioxygenase-like cupin family protein
MEIIMLSTTLRLATGVLLAMAMTSPAAATEKEHTLLTAQEIKWSPGPPSIQPGAQVAVLYGNPGKDGLFAMRLKMPKGYRIAPHNHPKPEIVTVISGTVRLGMGDSGDAGTAKVLPVGSFFAMSPGMVHYLIADDEAVIQLNSTGPWSLTYVNPEDDPRRTTN